MEILTFIDKFKNLLVAHIYFLFWNKSMQGLIFVVIFSAQFKTWYVFFFFCFFPATPLNQIFL